MSTEPTLKRAGLVALAVYTACVPLANWTIQNVGNCIAPGLCVIPVGFGLSAPSGVLWIGLALVARDVVQQLLGRWWVLGAIAVGAGLSAVVASPALAVASAAAFTLGELADFAVYTPLWRRNLYAAVIASGIVGAVIDSLIFLQLAFGSTDLWQGNTLGKVWMSLAVVPLFWIARRTIPSYRAVLA